MSARMAAKLGEILIKANLITESQLEQALTHTAMLYGGVQGIVGQNALPDIAPLQLPLPEEKQPTPEGAESNLL